MGLPFTQLSDFYFAATRIALEFPGTARTKARSSGEGVLHELHVRHLPVIHLAKDGEWSRDSFAALCRCVGKPAKNSHVFVLTENCFRNEGVHAPVLGNIVKRLADCIYSTAGSAPRHNPVQVGVAVVQRDVRDLRRAEVSHCFGISNIVQEGFNGLLRFHSFSLFSGAKPSKLTNSSRDRNRRPGGAPSKTRKVRPLNRVRQRLASASQLLFSGSSPSVTDCASLERICFESERRPS